MKAQIFTLSAFFLVGFCAFAADDKRSESVAPQGYQERNVAGWTIYVKEDFYAEKKDEVDKALELAQKQLEEIVKVVPPHALVALQNVKLWVSPEYAGTQPRAEYHPGADWLRENGRNPAMAHGVEITNTRIFEQETNRMPSFLLHELSHAFHHQILENGFDNKEIKAAYERAKASQKYDKVERHNGNGRPNTTEKAYAMTNPQEYFAESSEAYFGRNDFFPFTRDGLKAHDPEMCALVEKLWNSAP